LHEEPFIQVFGGLRLIALCDSSSESQRGRKGLIFLSDGARPHFQWACEPEKWLEFANQVFALVRSSRGHQYLSCGATEDTLVMVSSGEYYDEDFE
jgi:hypothetical protein